MSINRERFVGVDGCKKGWVAVAISDDGFVGADLHPSFAGLLDRFGSSEAICVDMPLGLVESGDRDADLAARAFLTEQASSVFSTPPRPVLRAADYVEACSISGQVNGKRLSKQTFAILSKMREVDAFVGEARLHEVHPEVSFRVLNARRLTWSKKTWGGVQQRLALLRSAGIELPEDLGDVNAIAMDDVVDAAVAAWSARRIARGEARSFPEEPTQRDRSGRSIAVLA